MINLKIVFKKEKEGIKRIEISFYKIKKLNWFTISKDI